VTTIVTIVTGLRWYIVQEPLVYRGGFRDEFIGQCEEMSGERGRR
jgi:hypothetical protein